VILAPSEVDVGALVTRLRAGEISDRSLREATSALARIESDGTFVVGAIEGSLSLTVVGPRGVEATQPITVGSAGLDVGEIALSGACR
jgi:hypothetical protein